MKKNMRKVAALGLCVALGATMLTACGGSKGKSASGGKTEFHSTILQLTQITLMKHIHFRYVRKQQNCMIWKQQNFRKHIMERNHFQMSARV